jgi:hypothetical protein
MYRRRWTGACGSLQGVDAYRLLQLSTTQDNTRSVLRWTVLLDAVCQFTEISVVCATRLAQQMITAQLGSITSSSPTFISRHDGVNTCIHLKSTYVCRCLVRYCCCVRQPRASSAMSRLSRSMHTELVM